MNQNKKNSFACVARSPRMEKLDIRACKTFHKCEAQPSASWKRHKCKAKLFSDQAKAWPHPKQGNPLGMCWQSKGFWSLHGKEKHLLSLVAIIGSKAELLKDRSLNESKTFCPLVDAAGHGRSSACWEATPGCCDVGSCVARWGFCAFGNMPGGKSSSVTVSSFAGGGGGGCCWVALMLLPRPLPRPRPSRSPRPRPRFCLRFPSACWSVDWLKVSEASRSVDKVTAASSLESVWRPLPRPLPLPRSLFPLPRPPARHRYCVEGCSIICLHVNWHIDTLTLITYKVRGAISCLAVLTRLSQYVKSAVIRTLSCL